MVRGCGVFASSQAARRLLLVLLGLTSFSSAQAQVGAAPGRPGAAPPPTIAIGPPWYRYVSSAGNMAVQFLKLSPTRSASEDNPLPTDVSVFKGETPIVVARTGPGGVAQIDGVREGTHGVIAIGPSGLSAVGLYVGNGSSSEIPGPQMSTYLIPAEDAGVVLGLIAERPEGAADLGQRVPDIELEGLRSVAPAEYYLGADNRFSVRFVSFESTGAYAVDKLKVFLIRDGALLGETVTDETGVFHSPALTPGYVGVLAVGPGGYSAFSANLLAPQVAQRNPDGTQFVAWQAATPPGLGVNPPESFGAFQQAVQNAFGQGEGEGEGEGGNNGANGNGQGNANGPQGGEGAAGAAAAGAAGGALLGDALSDDDKPSSPAGP